jgi:hypothetical protein
VNGDPLLETPFDQYERYKAVQEIAAVLRPHGPEEVLRVLDVGGYFRTMEGLDSLPLGSFLPEDEVTVVDTGFCSLPNFVQASGTALPFSDGSFDIVVSCDTLEHIPREERGRFVSDMLRVAADYVVIAAPFSQEGRELAERIVYRYVIGRGGTHEPLRQHIAEGLPDGAALRDLLASEGLDYCELPGGNLFNWLVMMLVRHYLLDFPKGLSLLRDFDRLYNLNFYGKDRTPPPYRTFFVISQKPSNALRDQIQQRWASPSRDGEDQSGFHLYQLLLDLLLLEENHRLSCELKDSMAEQQRDLRRSNELLAEQQQELRQTNELLAKQQNEITVLRAEHQEELMRLREQQQREVTALRLSLGRQHEEELRQILHRLTSSGVRESPA